MSSSIDRPVAGVLQEIVANLQDIVRSEVRLAKTELREDLTKARPAALLVGIGMLAAACSVVLLLLAIVYALALVMPQWAAALIVAIGSAIIGGVTLSTGSKQLSTVRVAPKTIESLKENVEWTRQQIK